jgi:diguanylate cyclase (GGDEF)-like protein/PAS domain S-box-containing protein/hemerythrin-like metal-binding protein
LLVDGQVVGAIYFVENASRYLYPLLTQWPGVSATAELQLVRLEADRVQYLSPLRQRADQPLSFSLPVNTPELAAAIALRGTTGILPHGYDYRGQAVLSYAQRIKGVDWMLLAKIDEGEAYALLNRLKLAVTFVVLLLLSISVAWFRQWQKRQSLFFQAEELAFKLEADASLLVSEQRFRIVFEQAAFAISRNTLNGEFIEVNDAWCAMLGYTREESSRLSWHSITHEDDRAQSQQWVQQLLAGEVLHVRMQKRYLHKAGRVIWGGVEVSLVRDAQGNPDYFITAIQDITERKQLEIKLKNNLLLLQMAMDGAQEALWEWDLVSGEAKFSPEYYTMLGYLPDEFPANQQEWLARIHPDDRDSVFRKIQEELDRHQDLYLAEYRMCSKDGRYRWLQGRGKCIAFDADGKPTRMVGINMDINERKQMELQVNFLAYHDKLTGLPNRALLFDRFSQALSQARRNKMHVGLLFADLDGFKQVNDQFGHEAGDAVLKMTAQRLLACVRSVDTVVRFGGDEFAVILGNIDDAQQVARVAEKIVQAFTADMVLAEGITCSVGVSVGISLFPENGTTMDGLLTAADQAMYDSKHRGKNTYSFFSSGVVFEEDQWIRIEELKMTGIAEIDEQHRNLARLINKLNSAWRHGQSLPVLTSLFDNLVTATALHFETEGRFMAQYGYVEQLQHESMHAQLLDEAMRLRARLLEGGELLALQTIKDWLQGHISHADQHLAAYLLSKGVR